ncbi:hypothetical protein DPSP01_009837 [Paraphaeosphaeria sporulosa]
MGLLDLPPEIFQRIIQKHVAATGLCSAWKGRGVCETFNTYITEEVFARQPVKVYSKRRINGLYRRGLAVFLEYRLNTLHGAHDLIPSVIRNVVDKLMQITRLTSAEARLELNRDVIAAIVRLWKKADVAAVKPTKRMEKGCSKDSEEARLLCLVVSMGNLDLTKAVLQHCTDPWSEIYCLGSPIEVAISAMHLEHVELLLADTKSRKSTRASIFARFLDKFFDAPVGDSQLEFVDQLLSLHYTFLGRPLSDYRVRWLGNFHMRGPTGEGVVTKILEMGFTSKLAALYRQRLFEWWGERFDRTTMKLFVTHKVFDMTQKYAFDDRYGDSAYSMQDESVLAYAVRVGDVDLVEVALKAGANANGAVNPNGFCEYPISSALQNTRCKAKILELLLDHGADLYGDHSVFHYCDLKTMYLGGDYEKRKILDAAIERANYSYKGYS